MGSVGYADIATARGASPSFAITPETNDNDKYWVQLPDGGAGNGVFREPTADPNGFRAEGTKGANCAGAEFTNEGNPLPSSLGTGRKSAESNSPGAFPTCTLTYGLLFDDDADVWGGGRPRKRSPGPSRTTGKTPSSPRPGGPHLPGLRPAPDTRSSRLPKTVLPKSVGKRAPQAAVAAKKRHPRAGGDKPGGSRPRL